MNCAPPENNVVVMATCLIFRNNVNIVFRAQVSSSNKRTK